tara:strand:- start:5406 stop:6017 length:612 start_codon:yes stop_codon:yes gene_type:complete
MRKISHVNLNYIFSRIREILYQKKNPTDPWLTAESIKILNSILKKDDVGLEFGSGRSSIWFANKVKFINSVEYKKEWFDIISKQIKSKKKLKKKINIRLLKEKNDYIGYIRTFKKESLDFCLVDSIWRDYCALNVIPKIKVGGILILDNANWYIPSHSKSPNSIRINQKYWSKEFNIFHNKVKNWRNIWTTNGVSDTSIWIKK